MEKKRLTKQQWLDRAISRLKPVKNAIKPATKVCNENLEAKLQLEMDLKNSWIEKECGDEYIL